MKRKPIGQDKIFANEAADKSLNSKYTVQATQYKNKQPNQKMGKSPKSAFLPNVCMEHLLHTDGQQAHEKMLHIANSGECKSQLQ